MKFSSKFLYQIQKSHKRTSGALTFAQLRSSRNISSHWNGYINRNGGGRNVSTSISVLAFSQAILGLALWMAIEEKPLQNDFDYYVPVAEVMKHNSLNDCWIAIDGQVYDVTSFLRLHPGGASRILKYAGKDASEAFRQMHSTETIDKMKDHVSYLGLLGEGEFAIEEITDEELERLEMIANKPPLSKMFNLSDFEFVAKKVLPKSTYTYYATGSSDEFTLRENHYAYSRIFFRPKILQDINGVDTSSYMLGQKTSLPIYITAFAGSTLAHPLGERNLQRAAYNQDIIQMVPKQLSYPIDEFFEEVPSDQKHWYQVHFDTLEELDNAPNFIKKIESLQTVKGIFLNVDLADLGNREKDSKVRAEESGSMEDLIACANNGKVKYPKNYTWKHVKHFLSLTKLPIGLKGVQRGEDVVLAAENGIKAVILSNHGGRQLDFSRPPLEVLAEAKLMLKEKGLEDKIEIYVDGGVRRGSDIIKAICLGAKGVGLGRPFLYAMASYGEDGVSKVIEILRTEMHNNMKLLGVGRIEDLSEELIDFNSLKFRNPTINDRLYDNAYQQLSAPRFKF